MYYNIWNSFFKDNMQTDEIKMYREQYIQTVKQMSNEMLLSELTSKTFQFAYWSDSDVSEDMRDILKKEILSRMKK